MTKLGTSPWNIRRRVVRCVEHQLARGTFADMWNIAEAWNIAVRTRGVFTHHAVFQKPACAERGLVRTASQLVSQLCTPSPSEEGRFLEGHVIVREICKVIGAEV